MNAPVAISAATLQNVGKLTEAVVAVKDNLRLANEQLERMLDKAEALESMGPQ
jgi:hypothetical protein